MYFFSKLSNKGRNIYTIVESKIGGICASNFSIISPYVSKYFKSLFKIEGIPAGIFLFKVNNGHIL